MILQKYIATEMAIPNSPDCRRTSEHVYLVRDVDCAIPDRRLMTNSPPKTATSLTQITPCCSRTTVRMRSSGWRSVA